GGPLVGAFEEAADRVRQEPLARARALLRRAPPLGGLGNPLGEGGAGWGLRRGRPAPGFFHKVKARPSGRAPPRPGIPGGPPSPELATLAASTLLRYPIRWAGVRLMACSQAARDTLASLTGVDDIEVATSPVDVSAIRPGDAPGSSPVVGACGSVNERKGADL